MPSKPSLTLLLNEALLAYNPPPRKPAVIWHDLGVVEVFMGGESAGNFIKLFNRRRKIYRLIKAPDGAIATGREDFPARIPMITSHFPDDTFEALFERLGELIEEALSE